jgi:hypothetical protein
MVQWFVKRWLFASGDLRTFLAKVTLGIPSSLETLGSSGLKIDSASVKPICCGTFGASEVYVFGVLRLT